VRTFQVSTGFGHLTTLENMLVVTSEDRFRNLGRWLVKPGSITRWNEQATEQALTILQEYDLADKCDTYAEELSGGQKRLLELARLAMLNPVCVLLDEPTAGVSPVLIEVLIDRIGQLRASGTTVVIVEHNMDVISRLCDDVVVLAEGRVLARGPLHEVRELRRVVEAYLG
jgi:branched-chain amino acid transport system ATP-binding protein